VKLSRVNTLLLVLIIVINGYTIVVPFLPSLFYKVQTKNGTRIHQLEQKVQAAPPANAPNSLTMPTALFDGQIFDGPDARTLSHGVWHRPGTSTPDRGGNTVVAGHRFTYTNPVGTFYHLDKIKSGDPIGVVWNNKSYRYTVTEVKVVGPNETSIEAPTAIPQLTIYTCTPLWLPKDRLVVIAKPLEVQP